MKDKIFEDKYYQKQPKKQLSDLNTKEQILKGQFYRERYDELKAEMQSFEAEWAELEELYQCDREVLEDAPNSFIPLISPIINGQIASITEHPLSLTCKGKGISDQTIASDAVKIGELIIFENDLQQRMKDGIKRYTLFGEVPIFIDYDENALDGFGLPTIEFLQPTKVFVDGNIKDIRDLQKGEYIIREKGFVSIMTARKIYGDDKADYISMGSNDDDFDNEHARDEQFSFTLLEVFHRNNKYGNLQKIEMDITGFVLDESDPKKPYRERVNNEYPFVYAGLYQKEGVFHRSGDGKQLKFMQETLNNLYDEIITACKYNSQGKTYIDPAGQCDPDEINADVSTPVICVNPNQNVKVIQGSGINPVVQWLIQNLVSQAERASRFSALMTGNAPTQSMTATQTGIMQSQGNTGIVDKKTDMSSALSFAIKYAVCICMEKWNSGRWLRVTQDKDDFEWVDARKLANVPVMIPADNDFKKKFRGNNPDSEVPQAMQFVDSSGKPVTKRAELDFTVNIGEGLPTNKVALYNIILSLAQIQLPDEQTGQPRPLLGYQQVRTMIEDLIGLPIDDTLEQAKKMMPQQMPDVGNSPTPKPMNISPNIPGAGLNGNMIGGGA